MRLHPLRRLEYLETVGEKTCTYQRKPLVGIGAAIALTPQKGPYAEVMKKLASVGRFGRAEDVASAVPFLTNPESRYVSGKNLTVDGGRNA
jgi:NAD(P)-dependent dehydrogenase (short-subunit alcohol dehydrogenase family)